LATPSVLVISSATIPWSLPDAALRPQLRGCDPDLCLVPDPAPAHRLSAYPRTSALHPITPYNVTVCPSRHRQTSGFRDRYDAFAIFPRPRR